MEVPRLGVKLELQLLAHTTATATQNPSGIYDLHHSSQQHQILNPLSRARDRTQNLLVPSWIRFRCTTMGTPKKDFFLSFESDLPRSSQQHQILNPLSKGRDRTCILTDTRLGSLLLSHNGNSQTHFQEKLISELGFESWVSVN